MQLFLVYKSKVIFKQYVFVDNLHDIDFALCHFLLLYLLREGGEGSPPSLFFITEITRNSKKIIGRFEILIFDPYSNKYKERQQSICSKIISNYKKE